MTGSFDKKMTPDARPLVRWLWFCALMVFAMILIGAITRLTESGLSIVQWNPVMGALPPLSEEQWQSEFALYKASPEFIKKNFWMELSDFKTIYFWEWLHRLWGRLIGLVFAVPLAFFWIRKQIPDSYKGRFLAVLALGGAQGFMGWYMVKSGLVDNPAVSHYRLAAHLGLALVIYVALVLLALSLSGVKREPDSKLFWHGCVVLASVIVTIFWGALTAGLDAGLIYNDSFPLMGGQWTPPDYQSDFGFIANILENPSWVQFAHRWLAMFSVPAVASLWAHAALRNQNFHALHGLMAMIFIQMGLGIFTLLSGVHLHVAVTHQAGAVVTLTLLSLVLYRVYPSRPVVSTK